MSTRRANVTKQPSTSIELPWNVGFYDGDDYLESVGAVDHAEAIEIADAYVRTGRRHFPYSWFTEASGT